jgi:hypothetical protein
MKTLIENHLKQDRAATRRTAKIVALFISLTLLVYSCAIIFTSAETRELGYHEIGSADYEVCLKPNQYFAAPCQPAGKQYVASLIDNLQTDFKYNFHADDNVNYQYSYNISAKLVATEAADSAKVLYENEEILLPDQAIDTAAGRGFEINEKINLDYGKYNNLITAFRLDYGLTLEASLIVSLNVKLHFAHADFSAPLDTTAKVALRVPLSERTINVAIQSDQLRQSDHLSETRRDFVKNLPFIITAAFSAVVFLLALVSLSFAAVRRASHRSTYEKKLRSILHSYNQLIVEVDRIPKVSRDNIIKVASFDELLDAQSTINQPILHLKTSPNHSFFIIEDAGMAYIYML